MYKPEPPNTQTVKIECKTIIVSDVHLGTKGSKAKELVRFLKQYRCKNLILNGDIIDGWQLRKSGKWKRKHTRFFTKILKMIEEDGTQITYIRGNHDDFLDQVLPFTVGNLKIARDMVYESKDRKYYIVHGDVFDSITSQFKWIAKLGDIGYTFLLWLNRQYNYRRMKKGLPYFSLSQKIKGKVKKAVKYIDDFETQLASMAKYKGCQGIICGHIHQPAMKMINDVHYMNSGDWVESMTALIEDMQGDWSLVYYTESDQKEKQEAENRTIVLQDYFGDNEQESNLKVNKG